MKPFDLEAAKRGAAVCKTDGDIAVVIFEDTSGPEIRQIGFVREYTREVEDE